MLLHQSSTRHLYLFAFALLGVVVSTSAALQGDTLLRWKFSQGEKLHVVVQQKTALETTAGPKPRKMTVNTTMEMDWLVDSVDEQGTADMTQTITRLKMRMETLGAAPVEFDTASTEQPEGAARYFEAASRLVGLELNVVMNARGEIESVELSDEARKLLDDALAGTTLPSLFSSEGLQETLKQTAAVLPAQPVSPSDTWEVSSAAKLPLGSVRQQTTYTFEGPRERDGRMLDAIRLNSKLQLGPPPSDEAPAATIAEQEHTGTLWFDVEAGRFVSSDVDQRLVTESLYRGTKIRVSATTELSTTYQSAE